MKRIIVLIILALILWNTCGPKPKAQWKGSLISEEPVQSNINLPAPWVKNGFNFTPRAKYHIRGVLLSKHAYTLVLNEEDKIAPYDFAIGWGPMSNAAIINALEITQSGRWYEYRWKSEPPIPIDEIITHSSNNHLIPESNQVLKQIKSAKRHEIIDLEGYLVDVSRPDGWRWQTSLSRKDSAGGSCEIIWITKAEHEATILN